MGMVYFMVIPGGWLADNILGHQKAVLYGAIIIALGTFHACAAARANVLFRAYFCGVRNRLVKR